MRRHRPSQPSIAATILVPLAFTCCVAAFGADTPGPIGGEWPQWRGPARDSSASALLIPSTWPPQLRPVWAAEVGPSDSGPVVASGKVYTFTRAGEREVATALDLETGNVLWQEGDAAPFKPMVIVGIHGAGPFSTPLVADGKVFTLGITQVLTARDAATGKALWRRGFDSEFKVTQPFYGNSLSPILVDGKLVIEVGGGGNGAVLAVDPASGEDAWRLKGDGPAYGSPIAVDIEGTRQIVTL